MTDVGETAGSSVRVEAATKRYRQGAETVEALRDATVEFAAGAFTAVMGASGSGKSTLMHATAGLTRLDAGRVIVDGQDLSKLSDRDATIFRRRRIGLVFQAFNLIPSLTAEQNVLLPVEADGRDPSQYRERLDRLFDRLGIANRRRHRPDALSGGEQQRTAIARALIADPAVVLADEPTGSLDSVTGQATCRLLKELCAETSRTVVIVTHEPAVAIWADRVVVMRDGRIVAEFPTADFPDAHALAAHYQDIVAGAPRTEEVA